MSSGLTLGGQDGWTGPAVSLAALANIAPLPLWLNISAARFPADDGPE